MITQEHIVDILVLQKHGYTPTEIARIVRCDPRTVRRYLADPALLGRPAPAASAAASWIPTSPGWRSWPRRTSRRPVSFGSSAEQDTADATPSSRMPSRPAKKNGSDWPTSGLRRSPGHRRRWILAISRRPAPMAPLQTYYLFSMVLGHSRMLYAEFLERCDMLSFPGCSPERLRLLWRGARGRFSTTACATSM